MNMCLFYQRESGFPKLSTVTRIDLHFRTTSASLQLPSLQSTFGRLSHHSAHSPFASEYPGHVSTEYPKTLSRVHASRIISPSNVRHRLYTCCNTSVESSQTYQHISHNISETPRAPPCISEYYSFLKHDYSGYSTLFVVFISISFRISLDFFLLLLCFMFRTFVLSFLSFILLFLNTFEYLYTHVLVVSQ
jgi:hypothetical protein